VIEVEQEVNYMTEPGKENIGVSGANNNSPAPAKGWGKENFPFPRGPAFIECDEMKCVGCHICEMACAMKHFGKLNQELSRIQIRKYLLPLPKAIQVTCVQCPDHERECEKACPQSPPAVYFDKKSLHMVIDQERCLGNGCLQCQQACPAKAIRSHDLISKPFMCDLCDTDNTGNREPQCVNICPAGALYFVSDQDHRFSYPIQDWLRKHADEKADLIAKRLYPLNKKSMGNPGWR
jgi:anaerobic carbon-monoxide dehydrogenase iron sulfur subunit